MKERSERSLNLMLRQLDLEISFDFVLKHIDALNVNKLIQKADHLGTIFENQFVITKHVVLFGSIKFDACTDIGQNFGE